MSAASPVLPLTPPAPLERLLVRLDQMDGRGYRECSVLARLVQRRLASNLGDSHCVMRLARRLAFLTERGVTRTDAVRFSLNLCRERIHWEYNLRGVDTRASRKVLFEMLQVLKREYLASLRLVPPSPVRTLIFGQPHKTCMTANIDASVRADVSMMGIVVQRGLGPEVMAELSLPCPARHSGEAEAHAAEAALKMMRALGARAVRIRTDSDAVIHLLSTQPTQLRKDSLALRALLLNQVASMLCVEVERVPRAFNHQSDRLAARVLPK